VCACVGAHATLQVGMLRGPAAFTAYMLSKEHAAISIAYIGSLLLTLYCAMG
jgi:hypothetical protein